MLCAARVDTSALVAARLLVMEVVVFVTDVVVGVDVVGVSVVAVNVVAVDVAKEVLLEGSLLRLLVVFERAPVFSLAFVVGTDVVVAAVVDDVVVVVVVVAVAVAVEVVGVVAVVIVVVDDATAVVVVLVVAAKKVAVVAVMVLVDGVVAGVVRGPDSAVHPHWHAPSKNHAVGTAPSLHNRRWAQLSREHVAEPTFLS